MTENSVNKISQEYYPNGNLKKETFESSDQSWHLKEYDENGNLQKDMVNYKDNTLETKEYYPSGQVKNEMLIKPDKTSESKEYDEDGMLRSEWIQMSEKESIGKSYRHGQLEMEIYHAPDGSMKQTMYGPNGKSVTDRRTNKTFKTTRYDTEGRIKSDSDHLEDGVSISHRYDKNGCVTGELTSKPDKTWSLELYHEDGRVGRMSGSSGKVTIKPDIKHKPS